MQKISHDSETPANGLQVITACAFIHQKQKGVEKIFLPKRAQTKKFLPGVYELPGGHIEFGENLTDGLKREIKEELGVEIDVHDPFAAFTYTNPIKGSHSVEIVYFATLKDESEQIRLNPEDHSEYIWLAENELPQIFNELKPSSDQEWSVLKKGFALLRGESASY